MDFISSTNVRFFSLPVSILNFIQLNFQFYHRNERLITTFMIRNHSNHDVS